MSETQFDGLTTWEDRSLHRILKDISYLWDIHKGENFGQEEGLNYTVPTELSDEFQLVYWRYEGLLRQNVPESWFGFLSNFGCIRMNFWCRNEAKITLVVDCEMYTKGLDNTIRGKGYQSITALHKILQLVSNESGYRIFEMARANEAAEKFLTDTQGYRSFGEHDKTMISNEISCERWNELLRLAKLRPAKVKLYTPVSKLAPSSHELNEVNFILLVAGIK